MNISKLLKKMGLFTIMASVGIGTLGGWTVTIYAQDITGRTDTFYIGDNQLAGNPELVEEGVVSIGSNLWQGKPDWMTDGNLNTHTTVSAKGNAIQITYWDNTMTNMTTRSFDEIVINEKGNNITSFQIFIRDPKDDSKGRFPIYEGTTIGSAKRISVDELTLPEGITLEKGCLTTDVLIVHIKDYNGIAEIAEVSVHKIEENKDTLNQKIEEAWNLGNSKRLSYTDQEALFDTIYEAKAVAADVNATSEQILASEQSLTTAMEAYRTRPEVSATEMNVVGYLHPNRLLGDYVEQNSIYDGDIDTELLAACNRVVAIGFWDVNAQGNIVVKDGYEEWERCITQLDKAINEIPAQERPEKWVTISPHGRMVDIENSIDTYVAEIVDFLITHDFDGVDLDWEYPYSNVEWTWYNQLIVELKTELNKHGKKLSCAVSDWNVNFSSEAIEEIDYFNVMFYDLFDSERHHASMENAGRLVDRLDQKGYPRYKLNLGLGWYGREKTNIYGNQWIDYDHVYTQLGESLTLEGENITAAIVGDNGQSVEGSSMDFGINGVDITKRKVEMAMDQNYGGVMIWHLTGDIEKDNPLSLMRAIEDQASEYDNRDRLENLALNKTYTATAGQNTVNNLCNGVDIRSGEIWELGATKGEVTVDFGERVTFNEIILMENSDKVENFKIEAFDGTQWKQIWEGTQMGAYKVCRFDEVTTSQLKVTIEGATSNVGLYEMEVYNNSGIKEAQLSTQEIIIDEQTAPITDVALKVYKNSSELEGITKGEKTLIAGTDYIVSPNGLEVTLTQGYLAALPNGQSHIAFDFTVGAPKVVTISKNVEVAAPKMNLHVDSEVTSGQAIKVMLDVANVDQPIYAQDIEISYDKDLFELVGCIGVLPTEIIGEKAGEGTIRILAATQDGVEVMTKNIELLFNAKEVDIDTIGVIAITKAELGIVEDSKSTVLAIDGDSKAIIVKPEPNSGDGEDVNQDGEVNVADLALVAYHYQKAAGQEGWDEAKQVDVNKNGVIDIRDLTMVASRILVNR